MKNCTMIVLLHNAVKVKVSTSASLSINYNDVDKNINAGSKKLPPV
jgi:hypothetical protein